MILEAIISVVVGAIKLLFSPLPNIPAAPEWITDHTDFMLSLLTMPISLVSYILTPTIFVFVVTISLVVFNFQMVYAGIMWVVRKLPIGVH